MPAGDGSAAGEIRQQKVEEAIANAVAMAMDAVVAVAMVGMVAMVEMVAIVAMALDVVAAMAMVLLMVLNVVAAVAMVVLGAITLEVLKKWRHAMSSSMEPDIDGESTQRSTC